MNTYETLEIIKYLLVAALTGTIATLIYLLQP